MDGDALKEALRRLLAQGDAASDMKLKRLAASKKAPPAAAAEPCPECQKPLVDGKCEACGYEAPAEGGDDDGLASLLEQGAAEG